MEGGTASRRDSGWHVLADTGDSQDSVLGMRRQWEQWIVTEAGLDGERV